MVLPSPDTSVSLLARLGPDRRDDQAWGRFVFVYGPHVLEWSRSYGLQESDALDVTQDVLVRISRQMERFEYDPTKSFRGWLRTVVHSAWCDWAERGKDWDRGSGDSGVARTLEGVPAREDLVSRLEERYDRELMQTAMGLVERRVEFRTWEAFRLLAIEGLPGKEAAERTGMKLTTVFAARSKVQKMIREEIDRLDPSS